MQRAQPIRKLVLDSQYVIDEHLVASAILARAVVRRLVGGVVFRNDQRPPGRARALRPVADARPFKPCVLGGPLGGRGGARYLGSM